MKIQYFLIVALLVLAESPRAFAGYVDLPKDENGWTIFTPSPDSRILYVSATGSDSTGQIYSSTSEEVGSNPFNPSGNIQPFATYEEAYANVRSGYPDWILVKRGDIFIQQASLGISRGRSVTEPFLIGSYGTEGEPPIFKTGAVVAMSFVKSMKYLAVSGIDFYAHTRDPNGAEYVGTTGAEGISFNGGPDWPTEGILLEGCKFRSYTTNIIVGYNNTGGITIRRCSFLDNYNLVAHSQGLFTSMVNDGILLEENIFDHNGWHSQAGSGGIGPATIFNHNTYSENTKNGIFRKNLFMRPSSIHNKFTANTYSTEDPGNIGNGTLSDPKVNNASQVQFGTYTVTCISEAPNGGIFSVKSPDNTYLSNATIGTYYNAVYFYIADGSVDFKVGDQFTFEIATGKSSNISVENNLYLDGEVGISMGGNTNSPYKFSNVVIKDNVLTEIGRSRPTNRAIGWGIDTYDNDVSTVSNNLMIHNNTASVTDTYGIWLGGSTRHMNVTGNVVYGIKGSGVVERTTYTGTTKMGVIVTGNYFQDNTGNGYTVDMVDDGGITFSGNKYYSIKTSPFYIDDVGYNLAGWQAATGDNSTFEQVSFPDSTRSIETYMQSIGETATIEAFITKARAQDRYNWDTRFTADAVNDYIRAGFGVSEYRQTRRLFRNVRLAVQVE